MNIILILLLAFTVQDSALEKAAHAVAGKIAQPENLEELFDASFLNEVPPDRLIGLFEDFHTKYGPVTRAALLAQETETSGIFDFTFEKGVRMRTTLTMDPAGKIIGLFFGPPAADHATFDEILSQMRKLPGTVNFLIARLGEKLEPVVTLNPETPLAIGSTFKLYILGALVEYEKPWTEVLTLKEDFRSCPSGVLQTWPVGSPLTVHTLAVEMISVSDNTATDHLLHTVGREPVERVLKKMGNSSPERSMPFLSTLEMFKLKSDPKLMKRYVEANEKGRRELLEGPVRALARERVVPYSVPTSIDTLEWFASAEDLCRLMDWFRKKNEATALSILTINPGLNIPKDRFSYIGYKGGSEPGVLNLTWLLKKADGKWYAASAGWNNPKETLDETFFLGLVQSALDLLGK